MSENFLSQEEIDALLGGGNDLPVEDEYVLGEIEKDIIGEVGNISMSTAATTLSSILNRQVLITTPRVSWILFDKIIEDCNIPKVVANIEFKHGLKGNNLLMVDVKDAAIIADLMMGGDGKGGNDTLTELELSAVSEAMNQMIGSASTSMATMIGREVDILPPNVQLWDSEDNTEYKSISNEKYICKIAFDLTVEGLIQSEIMQLFSRDAVEDIISLMMGDTNSSQAEIQSNVNNTPPEIQSNNTEQKHEPQQISEKVEKVSVQKPTFPPLTDTVEERKAPRNLDLIMDVPLEFSVVLGKTKKTIKEVLSFGNGSVVELNKLADEALEIYVNGKLIAQGEVVVINENFGIRITNIMSKEQRVQNLK
ncbi:flagellar motor switch phosphatase FliY [Alkalibaculum sp. M08DMB]|uniref:Flagellar motor switch phosphatase FliY n=1 Tax=Alkalibaculum sporogenes TaxID=2655001 RepID=A0A6A7K5X4_9FIRM|nr:flagellar motor switch phosphatase FliY [Alkalibaculum sporogenes]MPW24764.1 flagellar motor switch phosphatase FliY [Alkalibaculum sporogenes]